MTIEGIIYCCKCSVDPRVYYGSTTKSLKSRISVHKNLSKTRDSKFYKAIKTYGWDKFTFEIVEKYPCSSKNELVRREFDWIEKCLPEDLFNMEVKYGEKSEENKRASKESWTDERKKALSESQKGNKYNFKGGSVRDNKTTKRWRVIWTINDKKYCKSFSYGIKSTLTSEQAELLAQEFKSNLVF